MKKVLIAAITLAMAGAASAAIPQLNYECPGQIQFHSDEGGPVYINGQEAKVKEYGEDFFEVKGSGVILSISNINGKYDVSYNSKNGSGVCHPVSTAAPAAATSHKASPAEKACLKAVSDKTDVAQQQLQVIDVMDSEAGVGVTIKVPCADAPWSCLSDKKGHVQGAAYTGN